MTQRGNEALEQLLGSIVDTIGETLTALVGRQLTAGPGELRQTNPVALLADIAGQHAVVRGALDKDYDGQAVRFLFPAGEAATLCGHVISAAEETIEEQRKSGTLQDECLQTFSEVANAICSGVDGLIQESVAGEVGLHTGDTGVIGAGADPEGHLGETDLVAFTFPFTIDGYPESEGIILLESETAERWNGGSLASTQEQGTETTESAQGSAEDKLEDVPPAPVCGRLAAYLLDTGSLESIRKSCRRIGLDLDRHARTEIPNPAAHRGEVVVIEVSPEDPQRFEWCRRLKAFPGDIKVILLLRSPTRPQVVNGFVAEADVILGVPFTEPQLSGKLASLLEPNE